MWSLTDDTELVYSEFLDEHALESKNNEKIGGGFIRHDFVSGFLL